MLDQFFIGKVPLLDIKKEKGMCNSPIYHEILVNLFFPFPLKIRERVPWFKLMVTCIISFSFHCGAKNMRYFLKGVGRPNYSIQLLHFKLHPATLKYALFMYILLLMDLLPWLFLQKENCNLYKR